MNVWSAVTSVSCKYLSPVSDLLLSDYGGNYKDQNCFIFMLLNICHTEVHFKSNFLHHNAIYTLFLVPYIFFVKWATFKEFNEVKLSAAYLKIHKNKSKLNSQANCNS
jgi:hypothetical protein